MARTPAASLVITFELDGVVSTVLCVLCVCACALAAQMMTRVRRESLTLARSARAILHHTY
jgi:hypothetical protein